jgi:hypothetical protein
MPDIPEVAIWGTVSHWTFILSLLFASLYILPCGIWAQYKWQQYWFLPPPAGIPVEADFPNAPDQPNGCHMVRIGGVSYVFVCLRMLHCDLIVVICFDSCMG